MKTPFFIDLKKKIINKDMEMCSKSVKTFGLIKRDVQKLSGDNFIIDDSSTCRTSKIILAKMKPRAIDM